MTGLRVEGAEDTERGSTGEADGTRGRDVDTGRDLRDPEARVHRRQLGERAVREDRLHQDAEHGVANGEPVNALTERLDRSGEVLSEHNRVDVLHHPDEVARGDRHVEPVE